MSDLILNPSFDVEEFRKKHWQKKPVLLRNLIPNFSDAITAEELAGLACEEFIESRIVSEFESGKKELRNGPFSEADFTQLPDSNWTLLVQAVDHWFEDVAKIKVLFNFLPSWRSDDIMVSFAAAGGGVGAHFDYYDVFLLQGSGQRSWKVGQHCASNAELVEGSELGLLKNFEASDEYILNAGDALYLPPRFAHFGVADSDSLCYSIGFRAPSLAEMIEGFSDFLIKQQDPAERYEDLELTGDLRTGELTEDLLSSSFHKLNEVFADKRKFLIWFGCHVSQAKYPELIQPEGEELSKTAFASLLQRGVSLYRNPGSRFAFVESTADNTVLLFVDGAMTSFDLLRLEAIVQLCEQAELAATCLVQLIRNAEVAELLRQLLNQGSLLVSE